MNHKILNSKRYMHIFAKYICDSSLNIQNMDSKTAVGLQLYWNKLRYMQKKNIFFSPELSWSLL